jgi:hypothetical protein
MTSAPSAALVAGPIERARPIGILPVGDAIAVGVSARLTQAGRRTPGLILISSVAFPKTVSRKDDDPRCEDRDRGYS